MIKRSIWRLLNVWAYFGIDISQFYKSVTNLPIYAKHAYNYQKLTSDNQQFPLHIRRLNPILTEFKDVAGTAGGHYFFQDLWAAQKIYNAQPTRHVDIGSRIDGFIAHLLVFRSVEVIDIRPLKSNIPGLIFVQEDATDLARFKDNSLESISSLHAIEHFGLGRYGDPVDPEACFNAMHALMRVLQPGGRLYFSVPIGIERVEFNAHRVFAPETILKAFQKLDLLSFGAVDDAGAFHSTANPEDFARAGFSCGLFEFTKTG